MKACNLMEDAYNNTLMKEAEQHWEEYKLD
jgi:hypothetical protein